MFRAKLIKRLKKLDPTLSLDNGFRISIEVFDSRYVSIKKMEYSNAREASKALHTLITMYRRLKRANFILFTAHHYEMGRYASLSKSVSLNHAGRDGDRITDTLSYETYNFSVESDSLDRIKIKVNA